MADELQELHYLKGVQFINQLKLIIYYGEFHPVEGETNIFSAISEQSEDFNNLIKIITVKRGLACNPVFNRIFRKLYEK